MKILAWKMALAIALSSLSVTADAATVTWTNTHGGQWKTAANWSPNQVPGASDNAIIAVDGTYTVTANGSVSVANLTVGGANGTQTFSVTAGTLSPSTAGTIGLNGVLTLAAGTLAGGTMTVQGTMNWSAGTLTSALNIAPGGTLNINGNATKYLNGGQLVNAGTVMWSGKGSLEFGEGGAINSQGEFEILNDSLLVQTPFTSRPWFANSGTFRKQTATGATCFNDVQFRNSGTVDMQSGVLCFTNKTHTFSNGSVISGAGQVQVAGATLSMSGAITATTPLRVISGTLNGTYTLNGDLLLSGGQSSGNVTLNGNLGISGGKDTSTASIAGDLMLSGGEAAGKYVVAANLNFSGGLASGTITVNGNLNWQGGTLSAKNIVLQGDAIWYNGILGDALVILPGHTLTIPANSTALIQGGTLTNFGTMTIATGESIANTGNSTIYNYGLTILGDGTPLPSSGGGPPKFYNFGTLQKINTGTTIWSDFVLNNTGTITIQSGTLSFEGLQTHTLNARSQITGMGRFLVNGATLNLAANVICSSPFELTSGTLNAVGAFNGDLTWSGGALSGTLIMPTGQQLLLTGAATKSLTSQSILQNNGSALMVNGGPLLFSDRALFDNRGTFEVQDDVPFTVSVNAKPVLNNFGILRRTVSTRPLEFNLVTLLNSGTIEMNSGQLLFSGGTHYLNDGSQVLGATSPLLAGATLNLNGSVSLASALQFTSGTLMGTATINGNMTWSGGVIPSGASPGAFTLNGNLSWSGGQLLGTLTANGQSSWSAGTLGGTLNIPAGAQFGMVQGGNKIMTGIVNNAGNVSLEDGETIEMDSAAQINNSGVFQLCSGTPWKTSTGNRPVFVNTGTFRKMCSNPLLIPADVEFRNYGVIEAATSVVSFTAGSHGFYDGSTLAGVGAVQVDGATINLTGAAKVTGSFTLASGLVGGVGSLDGNWTWSGGAISGTITHKAGNQLTITGSATKTMNQNASLLNAGTVILDGQGSLSFYDKTTINNSGLFEWRGTAGFAVPSSSFKPVLINSGTFRKTLSTATLTFDVIQLQNSGLLDVQAGVLSFPANTHYLNDGSHVSGAAIIRVSGATMNLNGTLHFDVPFEFTSGSLVGTATINGNMTWSGGAIPSGSSPGAFTLNGDLSWSGGTLAGTLTANGVSSWSGGTLSGTLNIPAGAQFGMVQGGNKIMTGIVNNAGNISLADGETIEMDSAAQINNSGVFELSSGTPWKTSTGNRPVFVNTGTFRKMCSNPLLIPADVEFRNYGVLEAAASVVSFTAGSHGFYDGSSLAGAGAVQIDGATINLTGTARVSGDFNLASGLVSGIGALDGNWTWSGGAISGTITHKAGNQLTITGSATKTMNQNASLLNAGTVILDGQGSLSFYDKTTINNSGLFEWRSTAGFAVPSSSFKPVLINSGTFRKTLSTATLTFDVIQLQNSGLLDVQAGVLSFPANTHYLNDGSHVSGAAIIRVSGATMNLNGSLLFAAPFEFTSGSLVGTATINGNMSWSGGVIPSGSSPGSFTLNGNLTWSGGQLLGTLTANGISSWSAGTLSGMLNVPANQQFSILAGNTKLITGVLNNAGHSSLADTETLQMDSGGQINNAGVFEAFTGTPWKTVTGNRPVFNNTGTFRKLGDGLLQIPAAVEFRHYGTLEVTVNVLSFVAGVHSFFDGSTITGNGMAQVNGATVNLGGTIQVSSPFTLLSGLTTGAGCLDGNWTWAGGTVNGTLTNKAGNQISMSGNAAKTLDKNSTLLNAGTLIVDGSGAFKLGDAATVNNSGLCEWRSSAGFGLAGTTAKPRFINSGTFRKTVSTAEVAFDVIQLQNSGLLDVQAGVLSFPANSHTLTDGSRITGTAVARVSGATVTLAGTVTFDAPFEFTAGALQGIATIQGNVTWSGGTIPTGSSAGAFTVNGNLAWSGGILYGALTDNGTVDWSDGTLYGSLLIPPSSLLNIRNGGNPTLSGILTNLGQATTVGNASLIVLDKSVFVNRGLLEAQCEKPFTFSGNGSATLINSGTLRKTVSTRAMDFSSVLLQNSGTFDLQAGDLTFSANSHSFANGTRTTGAGTVRVIGGTLNLDGTSTMDAPFELASGILAGTATINANSGMTWSGGTIPSGSSASAFTVTGNLTWTAGTLNGSLTENGTMNWNGGLIAGTLSIPASSRLNVLSSGNGSISGVLQNSGTVVVSNNASILLLGGTPLINSGVFEVQNEQPFKPNLTKVNFINSGTFRKTTSTKLMKFDYVLLQNSGTLDVQAGELSLILNTHSFADGTRTTGSGAVRVAGATLNVAGNITLGPALALDSGYVAGNATLNGPFQFGGGQVSDTLTVNGQFSWAGGLLKGGLCAQGAASWSGGELDGWLSIATNRTLAIGGTATKTIKGGTLTNSGFVTVTAPVTIQGDGGAMIQNFGGFNVPVSLTLASLAGGGPKFNNYGALSLTNGFGLFTFSGPLSLFPSGRLELELAGRGAGVGFSQITGVPNLTLDGALVLRTVGGFEPALGDRLEIIKCAQRVGTFATYAANTPRLSPDYSPTNVTLFAAAPSITVQPQNQTVSDGGSVTFTVGAYGSQPMSYQWLWNGALLTGATKSALTFINVHPDRETNYAVVVTNVWGAVTSAPASLTVIILPVITQQPQPLTLLQGQDAVFTVAASGTHLSYRWKSGDNWIPDATNATVILPNATAATAGKYKVEVRNLGGAVMSADALLTVIIPPTITDQPASKNVNLGSAVTLAVKASGTVPFSYQWLKNGDTIPDANQSSFTIGPMTRADEGSYEVIVVNPAGYDTSMPAVLLINTPPSITAQPVSQTVNRGANVSFSVTATGVPAPTYQWQLNGVNLAGATQPTLLLTNVQPSQSGKYTVTVENSFGAAESVEADLQVITPLLPFNDLFAQRGILYTTNGVGRGTNCSATKEAGEPKHAGKGSATNSVWISWWAPANGIATFSTLGSYFDTVLAVYFGTNVNALTKVVADDDSAGFHCSKVSFNAQAGTYYQIAVAGVGATCGDIMLTWDLLVTAERLPHITQAPQDVTGNLNDIVVLQVTFDAFEPTAIQWFYQGQTLSGATNKLLVIPNLQATVVGGYAVRLTGASGQTVVSPPGDIQINTEGATGVSARNKFFDAFDRALTQ